MSWIEKQKNTLDFTLSSLFRRKARNTALVIVFTLVIFLLASVMFYTEALKNEASLVLQGAPDIIVQRLAAGRHDYMPVEYIDKIRTIKGVQSVRKGLWGYYYDPTTGANYTLMVREDFRHGKGNISVGQGVARVLEVKENGSVPFKTYDGSYVFLKIREIFSAESELVSSDLVLLSEEDFRKIFLVPQNYATDLVLEIRNKGEIPTIASKIIQMLPDTRPISREEILGTYDAVFDWRGGFIIVNFSTSIMALIILAWDKATGLRAEERREIGILKAIGWETSDVLLLKFWEGAVISLSSLLLGIILAYWHVFFMSSIIFEPVLKGWSVIYPKFRLTPFVNAHQVATLFFLTVVPYTVATIVPAWRAATIDPDTVMRT